MSHVRTVERLVKEIDHIAGVKLAIRWLPFHGLYLVDPETGNEYALGSISKWTGLDPDEQEAICRGLFRNNWIDLLGLNPPADGD
jgi:hypothetical protein